MDLALYDTTYRVEDEHWWFAGRRAIVFSELDRVVNQERGIKDALSLSDMKPRHRILDLGCGTGRNLVELEKFGGSVGLDVESKALSYCRERGRDMLVQASAESLPFRSTSFDLVIALDLLEHLDDDIESARDVWRILQPGGQFILFVPAYRWLWGPQDDVSHHRRRYTPQRLNAVLHQAGFRVDRVTHANLFLLPIILAGRRYLRVMHKSVDTENNLHPSWLNGFLRLIFSTERYLLKFVNLPLGVSLLAVATKVSNQSSLSHPYSTASQEI